jgi:hypothetical protein
MEITPSDADDLRNLIEQGVPHPKDETFNRQRRSNVRHLMAKQRFHREHSYRELGDTRILMVNKQICSEGQLILYNENTFIMYRSLTRVSRFREEILKRASRLKVCYVLIS